MCDSKWYFVFVAYEGCSKSIETLLAKNTFIDLEMRNTNPLQSRLLENAHTSASAPAIVGNTSGTQFLEWWATVPLHSAWCPLLTQNGSLLTAFSAWETAKSHTELRRVSREPDEPQECCVWRGKPESNAQNGQERYHDGAAKFVLPTDSVVCAEQHHEGDEGPTGNSPLWWFGLVGCTHDVPHHGSQRKRSTWPWLCCGPAMLIFI